MILNVSKQEISILIDLLYSSDSEDQSIKNHLKEKLERLQTTSKSLKSTIEQVRNQE